MGAPLILPNRIKGFFRDILFRALLYSTKRAATTNHAHNPRQWVPQITLGYGIGTPHRWNKQSKKVVFLDPQKGAHMGKKHQKASDLITKHQKASESIKKHQKASDFIRFGIGIRHFSTLHRAQQALRMRITPASGCPTKPWGMI